MADDDADIKKRGSGPGSSLGAEIRNLQERIEASNLAAAQWRKSQTFEAELARAEEQLKDVPEALRLQAFETIAQYAFPKDISNPDIDDAHAEHTAREFVRGVVKSTLFLAGLPEQVKQEAKDVIAEYQSNTAKREAALKAQGGEPAELSEAQKGYLAKAANALNMNMSGPDNAPMMGVDEAGNPVILNNLPIPDAAEYFAKLHPKEQELLAIGNPVAMLSYSQKIMNEIERQASFVSYVTDNLPEKDIPEGFLDQAKAHLKELNIKKAVIDGFAGETAQNYIMAEVVKGKLAFQDGAVLLSYFAEGKVGEIERATGITTYEGLLPLKRWVQANDEAQNRGDLEMLKIVGNYHEQGRYDFDPAYAKRIVEILKRSPEEIAANEILFKPDTSTPDVTWYLARKPVIEAYKNGVRKDLGFDIDLFSIETIPEEELQYSPGFIKASRQLFKSLYGYEFGSADHIRRGEADGCEFDEGQDLAEWGLEHIHAEQNNPGYALNDLWNKYIWGEGVKDERASALGYMVPLVNSKEMTWGSTRDAFYHGIFNKTTGISLLAPFGISAALKGTALFTRAGAMSFLADAGALSSRMGYYSAEAALWSATTVVGEERMAVAAKTQESIHWTNVAMATAIGAGAGGVFGKGMSIAMPAMGRGLAKVWGALFKGETPSPAALKDIHQGIEFLEGNHTAYSKISEPDAKLVNSLTAEEKAALDSSWMRLQAEGHGNPPNIAALQFLVGNDNPAAYHYLLDQYPDSVKAAMSNFPALKELLSTALVMAKEKGVEPLPADAAPVEQINAQANATDGPASAVQTQAAAGEPVVVSRTDAEATPPAAVTEEVTPAAVLAEQGEGAMAGGQVKDNAPDNVIVLPTGKTSGDQIDVPDGVVLSASETVRAEPGAIVYPTGARHTQNPLGPHNGMRPMGLAAGPFDESFTGGPMPRGTGAARTAQQIQEEQMAAQKARQAAAGDANPEIRHALPQQQQQAGPNGILDQQFTNLKGADADLYITAFKGMHPLDQVDHYIAMDEASRARFIASLKIDKTNQDNIDLAKNLKEITTDYIDTHEDGQRLNQARRGSNNRPPPKDPNDPDANLADPDTPLDEQLAEDGTAFQKPPTAQGAISMADEPTISYEPAPARRARKAEAEKVKKVGTSYKEHLDNNAGDFSGATKILRDRLDQNSNSARADILMEHHGFKKTPTLEKYNEISKVLDAKDGNTLILSPDQAASIRYKAFQKLSDDDKLVVLRSKANSNDKTQIGEASALLRQYLKDNKIKNIADFWKDVQSDDKLKALPGTIASYEQKPGTLSKIYNSLSTKPPKAPRRSNVDVIEELKVLQARNDVEGVRKLIDVHMISADGIFITRRDRRLKFLLDAYDAGITLPKAEMDKTTTSPILYNPDPKGKATGPILNWGVLKYANEIIDSGAYKKGSKNYPDFWYGYTTDPVSRDVIYRSMRAMRNIEKIPLSREKKLEFIYETLVDYLAHGGTHKGLLHLVFDTRGKNFRKAMINEFFSKYNTPQSVTVLKGGGNPEMYAYIKAIYNKVPSEGPENDKDLLMFSQDELFGIFQHRTDAYMQLDKNFHGMLGLGFKDDGRMQSPLVYLNPLSYNPASPFSIPRNMADYWLQDVALLKTGRIFMMPSVDDKGAVTTQNRLAARRHQFLRAVPFAVGSATLGLGGAAWVDDHLINPDQQDLPAYMYIPGNITNYAFGGLMRTPEAIIRNTIGNGVSLAYDGSVDLWVPYSDRSVIDTINENVESLNIRVPSSYEEKPALIQTPEYYIEGLSALKSATRPDMNASEQYGFWQKAHEYRTQYDALTDPALKRQIIEQGAGETWSQLIGLVAPGAHAHLETLKSTVAPGTLGANDKLTAFRAQQAALAVDLKGLDPALSATIASEKQAEIQKQEHTERVQNLIKEFNESGRSIEEELKIARQMKAEGVQPNGLSSSIQNAFTVSTLIDKYQGTSFDDLKTLSQSDKASAEEQYRLWRTLHDDRAATDTLSLYYRQYAAEKIAGPVRDLSANLQKGVEAYLTTKIGSARTQDEIDGYVREYNDLKSDMRWNPTRSGTPKQGNVLGIFVTPAAAETAPAEEVEPGAEVKPQPPSAELSPIERAAQKRLAEISSLKLGAKDDGVKAGSPADTAWAIFNQIHAEIGPNDELAPEKAADIKSRLDALTLSMNESKTIGEAESLQNRLLSIGSEDEYDVAQALRSSIQTDLKKVTQVIEKAQAKEAKEAEKAPETAPAPLHPKLGKEDDAAGQSTFWSQFNAIKEGYANKSLNADEAGKELEELKKTLQEDIQETNMRLPLELQISLLKTDIDQAQHEHFYKTFPLGTKDDPAGQNSAWARYKLYIEEMETQGKAATSEEAKGKIYAKGVENLEKLKAFIQSGTSVLIAKDSDATKELVQAINSKVGEINNTFGKAIKWVQDTTQKGLEYLPDESTARNALDRNTPSIVKQLGADGETVDTLGGLFYKLGDAAKGLGNAVYKNSDPYKNPYAGVFHWVVALAGGLGLTALTGATGLRWYIALGVGTLLTAWLFEKGTGHLQPLQGNDALFSTSRGMAALPDSTYTAAVQSNAGGGHIPKVGPVMVGGGEVKELRQTFLDANGNKIETTSGVIPGHLKMQEVITKADAAKMPVAYQWVMVEQDVVVNGRTHTNVMLVDLEAYKKDMEATPNYKEVATQGGGGWASAMAGVEVDDIFQSASQDGDNNFLQIGSHAPKDLLEKALAGRKLDITVNATGLSTKGGTYDIFDIRTTTVSLEGIHEKPSVVETPFLTPSR